MEMRRQQRTGSPRHIMHHKNYKTTARLVTIAVLLTVDGFYIFKFHHKKFCKNNEISFLRYSSAIMAQEVKPKL